MKHYIVKPVKFEICEHQLEYSRVETDDKAEAWAVFEILNCATFDETEKWVADFGNKENADNYVKMLNQEQSDKGYFVISRVHRDDLDSVGFDVSEVDDYTMERLADKLGDAYTGNNTFWIDLPIIAEKLDIPKKNKECYMCSKDNLLKGEYKILDGHHYCLECYKDYKDE